MHNLSPGVYNPASRTTESYKVFLPFYQEEKSFADPHLKGAVCVLDSGLVNEYNLASKLWMRASALGASLWQGGYSSLEKFRLLTRLQANFYRRGIGAAAVTSQQCERFTEYCAH